MRVVLLWDKITAPRLRFCCGTIGSVRDGGICDGFGRETKIPHNYAAVNADYALRTFGDIE